MSTLLASVSLPQLLCFVTVVDAGSFAEAGRRLGMSTSGVSKTVARFEAAHGVRLLHRSTHRLSLTDEGERLIDTARATVGSVAELETALGELAGTNSVSRVRISAPVSFMQFCLAPLLPAFHAEHPDILLDLRATDRNVDLARDGIDLAIRPGPIEGVPGHLTRLLFRFSWVVCASPDYLQRRGVPQTPADLTNHDLIGFRNSRTGMVDAWQFGTDPNGRSSAGARSMPGSRFVIDDAQAVWNAVLAGTGLAWAPDWMARDDLQLGRVVEVLRDCRGREMPVSVLRRDQPLKPKKVEKTIAFLVANVSRWSG